MTRRTLRINDDLPDEENGIHDLSIARLFHDIGRLIPATSLPTHQTRVTTRAYVETSTLRAAEVQVFGVRHTDVGRDSLDLLASVREIVDESTFHHEPSSSGVEFPGVLTAVQIVDGQFGDMVSRLRIFVDNVNRDRVCK